MESKRIFKDLYMAMRYALQKTEPKPESKVCPHCGGELYELSSKEPGTHEFQCLYCKKKEVIKQDEGDRMLRAGIMSLMEQIRIHYPDIPESRCWGEMLQELPNGDYLTLFKDSENGYDGDLASPFACICLETKDKEGNPCIMDLVTVEAPTKALQEYNKSIDNPVIQNTGDLEIRVYADPKTEDYTDKFVINNDDIQKVINT